MYQWREQYEKATQKWPLIRWVWDAYHRHALNTKEGEGPTRHPVDLYLGGAAGYRIAAAWEVIDREISPSAMRILNRLPKADYLVIEDLWADLIHYLSRDDSSEKVPHTDDLPAQPGVRPAKIIRYRAKTPLLNYLVTAASRKSITRYRKIRRKSEVSYDSAGDAERSLLAVLPDESSPAPDDSVLDQERQKEVAEVSAKIIAAIPPGQRLILVLVFGPQKLKQKEAAKMLNWSEDKASKQIKAAESTITGYLKPILDRDGYAELAGLWSKFFEDLCKPMQDSQNNAL